MLRIEERIKVLALIDSYLPGFRSGGPARALAGLIESAGDDCDFHVVTRHADWPDLTPYTDVPAQQWVRNGSARVWYGPLTLASIRARILELHPRVLLLNSLFSRLTIRTLLLRRLRLIPNTPVLLAP